MSKVAPVQGFVYFVGTDEDPRNDTVCQIEDRATVSDLSLREHGPAFLVRFGDGVRLTAYWDELRPWYPV